MRVPFVLAAGLVAGFTSTAFARPPTLGWIGADQQGPGLHDVMQVIPAPTHTQAASTAWVLYLNHNGGTFTPGDNDSRTHTSSIPTTTAQIAPWNISAANWQSVVSCIQDEFKAYSITVTDQDPGQTPHIEAVIAGSAADVGLPANVGGVSPFTTDCGVIQNSIVFAFAQEYGTDYQTVCEVAAQEIAHSFGLDHEVLASDPMTYLSYNGHKTFQDQTASCGETNGPRQCGLVLQGYPSCRPNQNSVQLLLARVGPAGTADTAPPTVAITSPSNGATVAPGFAVDVNASDNVAVTKVELYVDGTLVNTLTSAPYAFTTASSMASGSHTIETRAYDATNMSSSSVNVTVDPAGNGGGNGSGNGSGSGSDGGDGGYIPGGCSSGGGATLPVAAGIVIGLWIRRRRR